MFIIILVGAILAQSLPGWSHGIASFSHHTQNSKSPENSSRQLNLFPATWCRRRQITHAQLFSAHQPLQICQTGSVTPETSIILGQRLHPEQFCF